MAVRELPSRIVAVAVNVHDVPLVMGDDQRSESVGCSSVTVTEVAPVQRRSDSARSAAGAYGPVPATLMQSRHCAWATTSTLNRCSQVEHVSTGSIAHRRDAYNALAVAQSAAGRSGALASSSRSSSRRATAALAIRSLVALREKLTRANDPRSSTPVSTVAASFSSASAMLQAERAATISVFSQRSTADARTR